MKYFCFMYRQAWLSINPECNSHKRQWATSAHSSKQTMECREARRVPNLDRIWSFGLRETIDTQWRKLNQSVSIEWRSKVTNSMSRTHSKLTFPAVLGLYVTISFLGFRAGSKVVNVKFQIFNRAPVRLNSTIKLFSSASERCNFSNYHQM